MRSEYLHSKHIRKLLGLKHRCTRIIKVNQRIKQLQNQRDEFISETLIKMDIDAATLNQVYGEFEREERNKHRRI